MTLPKPTRRREHDQRLKRLVTTILLLILAVVVISSFSSPSFLRSDKKISKSSFKLEVLDYEKQFHDTIRSCLPANDKKCKTYIPDAASGSSKRVQRVALIALPGDVRSSVARLLDAVRQVHNGQAKSEEDPEMDVIVRASVPPYGYGKTHGLTKIIRIQPRPLVLDATTALQSALDSQDELKLESITLADLKAAMRIILRFHCRLSHVSAHTAILSLQMSDLRAEGGVGATTQVQSFVDPTIGHHPPSFEDRRYGQAVAAAEDFARQLLSQLQKAHGVNVFRVMDDVLTDELNKTKNFSAWPCLSFWAVGDEPNAFELSPLVQRIARSVSPDCVNDALANCWVGRDTCEAHGDGPCRDDGKQYATA